MKKNKSTIILILVFFVGLSVMLYPTISDYVNQRNQSRAVASYAQDVDLSLIHISEPTRPY